MPQELLRDVLRPGDSKGRARRLSIVPLSIALHVVAIAAVLIIPLVAEVDLPRPASPSDVRWVGVRKIVLPEVGRTATPTRRSSPAGAPLHAPNRISPAPEPPRPAIAGPPDPFPGATSGLSVGIGSATEVPAGEPLLLPPPPAVTKLVRPGGAIREPRRIVNVTPVYPPFAQQARVEGVVILEAVIDERGDVDRVHVLRSAPMLDQAAIDAVRAWKYTPTLLNGIPVQVLMTITVQFTLRE